MIPLPDPLTQAFQDLPRPLEILRLEIDLTTEPDPPAPGIEHNRHEGVMILHHRHNQPLRHGRGVLVPDLAGRIADLQGQADVREEASRQAALLVVQHLRLQHLGDRGAAPLHHLGAVAHDLVFAAADFLAEGEGVRNAEVGRVVDGADEFELLDELALGAWREGVVDLGPAGDGVRFVAVGCRQRRADERLILEWDVEDGAAAGNE